MLRTKGGRGAIVTVSGGIRNLTENSREQKPQGAKEMRKGRMLKKMCGGVGGCEEMRMRSCGP